MSEVEKECFRSQEGLVERQSEVHREGTGGNSRCKGNCDEGTEGDRKREGEFVVRCPKYREKKLRPCSVIYSKINIYYI